MSILNQQALLELTGLRQKAALRRHLRKAGIPFREIGGRIVTTEAAFDAALSGRDKKKNEPRWGAADARD